MEPLLQDAICSESISKNFFSKGRIDPDLFLNVIKILSPDDTNKIIFLMTATNEEVPLIITILKSDYDTKYRHIVSQNEWQEKLLECLVIIKNYNIIRMMGYTFPEIEVMKKRYFNDVHNVSVHINKVMKSLYFLSENLKIEETNKLIEKVNVQLNIAEKFTDDNELENYILYWIKKKFISINSDHCNLGNLLKVLKPVFFNESSFNFIDYWKSNTKLTEPRMKNDDYLEQQSNIYENNFLAKASNGCNDDHFLQQLNGPNRNKTMNELWNKQHYKQCFIFNIINFTEKHKSRLGSKEDEKRLKIAFENCGFHVDSYRDFTKKEMVEFLDQLNGPEYNKPGCIFMCILSHGSKDEVIFNDAETLSIEFIKKKFCIKNLENVFKFIILQSCQGSQIGLVNSELVTDGPTEPASEDCPLNYQHFGIFQSTISGFVSMRHEIQGTWFIQDICDVLENCTPIKVLDLVTKVNEKMRKRRGQSNEKNKLIVQLSCLTQSTISEDYIITQDNK